MNLNKVLIAGNITKDIELKYIPSGTAVVSFGVAVNRSYTVNGETKKEVTFANIVAWGKTAEFISKYFSKGKPIFIEGRLSQRSWDDKEGRKQYRTEIIAENIQFVGYKKEENKEENKNETTYQDDEVPF